MGGAVDADAPSPAVAIAAPATYLTPRQPSKWRLYLPRGKLKRGWRNKGGGAPLFQ